MDIKAAITDVIEGKDLSKKAMQDVMRAIMTGECSAAQIAGFLVAQRMKGESVAEISGAASVMRELATPVEIVADNLVDIVGTGGDGSQLFNVSTASSMVVAAAGGKVAKHGNRSVSSSSGSADLLEAAGVNLALTSDQVARCVDTVGVGFMFAVNHHSAMKHAIGPRKELATRTLFNLLGPLTNPAGVKKQLLGVFNKHWLRLVAEVLQDLGSEHVLVVHSCDGLDEISIADTTDVVELKGGVITEYQLHPTQFDLPVVPLDTLRVTDAESSLALIQAAFSGQHEGAAAMIALNAGAALYAADVASSIDEGVMVASDVIDAGLAAEKLRELAEFTQSLL